MRVLSLPALPSTFSRLLPCPWRSSGHSAGMGGGKSPRSLTLLLAFPLTIPMHAEKAVAEDSESGHLAVWPELTGIPIFMIANTQVKGYERFGWFLPDSVCGKFFPFVLPEMKAAIVFSLLGHVYYFLEFTLFRFPFVLNKYLSLNYY